jgi:hypothetical protein
MRGDDAELSARLALLDARLGTPCLAASFWIGTARGLLRCAGRVKLVRTD